jgi:hypothetical protein
MQCTFTSSEVTIAHCMHNGRLGDRAAWGMEWSYATVPRQRRSGEMGRYMDG